MKCGAKCFLVEVEQHDERMVIPVNARTPIAARKVIRKEYGSNVEIVRVKRK